MAGKYYVVDAAYNNATGYLAPYRNVRYHMQHWCGARRPSTPQELFNFKHSQVRVIIEHAFGRLKNKFQILFRVPNYRVHRQKRIVVACMALHNFIIDNGGKIEGFQHVLPPEYAQDVPAPPPSHVPPRCDSEDMALYRDVLAFGMFNGE